MEGPPQRQDQVLIPQDISESFEPIHGQSVTLRPLQPEDAGIETAFVSGLSAETRANRLLGGAIRITREYIAKLTTVDYSRDMALAATVMLEGEETLIGVARYVLDPDGRGCEFAIVVADAWQGRGMLEMVKKVGFSLARNPDDATVVRASREL